MHIDLTGMTALVCGASEGIGNAISVEFADSGATVVLFARNKEKLEQCRAELAGTGHHVLCADFDDPESVSSAVNGLLHDTGISIDIIVNNSGGPAGGPLMSASTEDFVRAMNRLLLSSHNIVTICSEGMKNKGFGRIINIISTSVRQPIDNLGVSNTIRGATSSWAKTLSKELAPFGITVNNILPGATRTARLEDIITKTSQKTSKSPEHVEKTMLAEIPMGRFAEPKEIAFAATFLASRQAAYINGINLTVDGGRTKSLL